MGYHRAGFDVVGVDLHPQPNFPFEFHQADALTFSTDGFDAIHASPPCQAYSSMSACRPGLSSTYPDLVAETRDLLVGSGVPYVLENVPRAPLENPEWLCGTMFGLDLYRHRGFETNWRFTAPPHPPHVIPASRAGHWRPGTIMSVSGHCSPVAVARSAMGIDWMRRDELAEAIPPAYTQFIGEALITHIKNGG